VGILLQLLEGFMLNSVLVGRPLAISTHFHRPNWTKVIFPIRIPFPFSLHSLTWSLCHARPSVSAGHADVKLEKVFFPSASRPSSNREIVLHSLHQCAQPLLLLSAGQMSKSSNEMEYQNGMDGKEDGNGRILNWIKREKGK
jgi:hypothetical protein